MGPTLRGTAAVSRPPSLEVQVGPQVLLHQLQAVQMLLTPEELRRQQRREDGSG